MASRDRTHWALPASRLRARVAPVVLVVTLTFLIVPGTALGQRNPPADPVERPATPDRTVWLALADARDLVDTRTNRTVRKFDLEDAERRLLPMLSLRLGTDFTDDFDQARHGRSSRTGLDISPGLAMALPTDGTGDTSNTSDIPPNRSASRGSGAGSDSSAFQVASETAPEQRDSPREPVERPMTLDQAVQLALTNNRDLVDARTNRTLQKFDLEDAENRFRPKLSLRLGTDFSNNFDQARDGRTSRTGFGISPGLTMALPTGGSVGLAPSWSASRGSGAWSDSSAVSISLSQPLLKGGGLEIGRAPVVAARIAEERNVLDSKATVMDTVTSVIKAYRAVIKAELQLDIAVRALERARSTLSVNRLMIEAGRMARQDITQTEADIVSRELAVVRQRTTLDDTRRRLNILLDLDGSTRIKPIEPLAFEPVHPDVERSQAIARENHTPYRNALIALREAENQQVIAENNALWDLSLSASASFSGAGDSPGKAIDALSSSLDMGRYAVGLSLAVPLGDSESNARERERINARLSLQNARRGVATTVREMEIAVRDAVQAVEDGNRGVVLAQRARELAEKKLEIEQEKLRLGLSSTYQITSFQTDLVNAQISELDATIDHLNTLTDLDRMLGTVLETWQIEIK